MNVLDGPRREIRRVIYNGSEYTATATARGLELPDGRIVQASDVTHQPPCTPSKIVCIHLNYRSRFFEFRNKNYDPSMGLEPTYFLKPPSTLNGHLGEVVRPVGYRYLNYESEIAMVIGKPTRNITPDEAWDHIAGFSCALDMGLQDMRDTDSGSMLRVKGADGFCPIGPGLVSGVDIRKQELKAYRNGVLVQQGRLEDEMIWGFDYLLADLARHITFLPGDVILTGTPANSRPLEVGDTIEVDVSDIGRLSCRVAEAPAPRASVGHQPTQSEEVRRVSLGNDERLPPVILAALSARA